MTNTITVDQLKELLQIQKEFDDCIPTLNVEDSKVAYIIKFFKWFDTLETFKSWKKKPGEPLDVQLDELADLLSFGLSIANQQEIDVNDLEDLLPELGELDKNYKIYDFAYGFMGDVVHFGLKKEDAVLLPLDIACTLYSPDHLIEAYKKKMQRNHDRQDCKSR